MTVSLMCLSLLLGATSQLVQGQFPAVCNTDESLASKTCCPNNCGSRGACVNMTDTIQESWSRADEDIVAFLKDGPGAEYGWPMDVRYQWPLRVFQRVCECYAGWRGYDCSRCDFGYIEEGGECVKRSSSQLSERKDFSKLSLEKRLEYLDILSAAKNEDEKEWAVVTEEPMDDGSLFQLQNVSTYDMLVVLHFLSAREKDNDDCKTMLKKTVLCDKQIDFAHEFSSFTTWHRYYLLIIESELRRIAEKMNINDFALAYWDWTPTNEAVFNNDTFGQPPPGSIEKGEQVDVTGKLFDNGDWPLVCYQHYEPFFDPVIRKKNNCKVTRDVCNIQNDRNNNARLKRGAYEKDVENDVRFLPDIESIKMALAAESNSLTENDGFRLRLEGYVDLYAGEDPKCTIDSSVNPTVHNNMHNAVHIYIGGHMRALGSASNDPIFFLHHANIDRILESWLVQFNGNPPSFSESSSTHPGYNETDYLTPMFPLRTNADMYKTANELGYSYDELFDIPSETYGSCAYRKRGGHNPDATPAGPGPGDSAVYHLASLPYLLVLAAFTALYINFWY